MSDGDFQVPGELLTSDTAVRYVRRFLVILCQRFSFRKGDLPSKRAMEKMATEKVSRSATSCAS